MWQIKKSKILLFLLYITSQASTHPLRFSPATGTAMFSKRSTIAFMKHYLYITLLKVTFIESRSRLVKKKVCLAISVYLIGIGILQILNRRSTVNVKNEVFVFTGEGVKMTAFEGNLLIKTSHYSYSTKFNSNLIE